MGQKDPFRRSVRTALQRAFKNIDGEEVKRRRSAFRLSIFKVIDAKRVIIE